MIGKAVFCLMVAMASGLAFGQFSPEAISSGVKLMFPDDPKQQGTFNNCLNKLYGAHDKSELALIGTHSLHILSRLSRTPVEYQPVMKNALYEVNQNICKSNPLVDVHRIHKLASLTNTFTWDRGRTSILRTHREVSRDLCLNMRSVELGIEQQKIIEYQSLDADKRSKVDSLCNGE